MTDLTPPPAGAVHGYLRVSAEEQRASGLGLAAQRHAIDAEAARHGWAVTYHADEGVSGTVRPEDRPALAAVLDALGRGDVLVAAKLDRLGRRTTDVLGLADRADREGWRLVLLDLALDTGTPVGAFTLAALAAVAQLERDLIAQRTRDAMSAARRRGQRHGRPVTLPADIRQRIAAMRRDGATLHGIADTLTAEGVPTARGGPRWWPSTVASVLDSLRLDAEAAHARQDAA